MQKKISALIPLCLAAVVLLAFLCAPVAARAHTVSAPVVTSADTPVKVGTTDAICASGAVCSEGHDVEYIIDFDDGSEIAWSEATSLTACAEHYWSASGSYAVRAMARCSGDHAVTSEWSPAANVTVICTSCQDNDDTGKTEDGGGGCFIGILRQAARLDNSSRR